MRALVVAMVLTQTVAAAEAPRELAQAHFTLGRKAYDAGHYREAAGEFAAAYALEPMAALLFNEAQAWRRDFELSSERESARRAVDLYRRYLSAPLIDDQDRREAADRLAALSTLIVEAKPAPAAPPPPPPRKRRTGLWIGIGVGAAAAVALGVGLGVGLSGGSDRAPSLVARW